MSNSESDFVCSAVAPPRAKAPRAKASKAAVLDDDSDCSENYAPAQPAAKAKGKPAAKAAKPKPAPRPALSESSTHNAGPGKAIEEIYQKKTQLEHILLRPDTYIGSTEKQQQKMWVHDGTQLVMEEIEYVPGLYKIFDEILVNAADNKVRDPSMDSLKVDINAETNTISITNNGAGVPVEIHKEEGIYVPELIFGHLLTSSNYDDSQKKVTGGRNGYGAKLANIFSTGFTVETCDGARQKQYRQRFHENMGAKDAPKVTACKASDNWTNITFSPDLAKFGMTHLEAHTVALMRKRVYDLAGVLGKTVKVFLNGDKLPVKAFQDYVELYLPDKTAPRIYERFSDRWEVCITPSDGQFHQVSFVNSICTIKGGTHVNYIVDQITKSLSDTLTKKNKNSNVKAFMVKNYLSVFINAMIENPAFDSQTKETLTLRASSFGSKCELPERFLKKVLDSGVADRVLSFASFKQNKEMKKSDGSKRQRITGVTKLQDANDAGTRLSETCTLILTEGDSAKALVIDGLSVAGRDSFGVFPLRGKLLNVREASMAQITGNAEIQNIKQIMGLQHGKVYTDVKQLRYGHLMIMTDQDHDGSHIKGLIMNFFHHFYPSLLKLPGFLLEFITPIVKATKRGRTLSFYTIPEYETWREEEGAVGWNIKYYKGLGTSTKDEAIEYFSDLGRHRKEFLWQGDVDGSSLELAFSKKKVEDRKIWLQAYVPGTYLDMTQPQITYSDFVNQELILFSRADLERSIPSMVDGLKPGQRKILFACFKRNLRKEIKVAQLSGYVSEHAAYHHGEASLQSTIVGMAQSFVGSNNINLLAPKGQFGTRLQGGKDAASARYIHTMLERSTRALFHEADDQLLTYLADDGQRVEPQWYVPVIPLVLVNGAEGIGTGWSTFIPNYDPAEVCANIRALLAGQPVSPMRPWYRGFKGPVTQVPSKTSGSTYTLNGVLNQVNETTLEITELPIRRWTQDYKEFLETLIKPEDKGAALLTDYREHHSGSHVHFTLQVAEGRMADAVAGGLDTRFKLSAKLSTGNMMLFDQRGKIKRYESPEAILVEFFHLRMDYYTRRRALLIQVAQFELNKLSNRVRFILAVISGDMVVSNRRRAAIEADLEDQGFERMPNTKKGQLQAQEDEANEVPSEEAAAASSASYDYLLSMALWSLTIEKVEALQADMDAQQAQVEAMQATTPAQLYAADLDTLEAELRARDAQEAVDNDMLASKQRKAAAGRSRGKGKAAAVKGKAKKKQEWESDASDAASAGEDSDGGHDLIKAKAPARKAPVKAAIKPDAALKPEASFSSQPSAASQPSSSGAASLATSTSLPAAPKPAGSKGGGKRRLGPSGPQAASAPAAAAQLSQPASQADSADGSLMERLTGKLGQLAVEPSASSLVGKPSAAAGKPPGKPRAKKVGTGRGAGREAATADAKSSPWRQAIGGSAAAGKGQAAATAGATAEDSPAPAPQGKVRRMRPSPFHKGSATPKGSSSSGDDMVAEVPAARPARARAAVKKTYVEISDSDKSESAPEEDGSEFEVSE